MPGRLYQNFISHPISLLLDVMGDAKIQNVQSKYNRVVPHMKTDELRVSFENENMLGSLSLSMAASPRYLFVNVYGTEGTLRVDFLNRYVFLDKPMSKLPRVVGRSVMAMKQAKVLLGAGVKNAVQGVIGKYNLYEGNETLIRMFYKSILEGGRLPISPEEGVRSMEVMDEIWKKLPRENGRAQKAVVSKNGAQNGAKRTKRKREVTAAAK
jgi:predicted dehydrogenase